MRVHIINADDLIASSEPQAQTGENKIVPAHHSSGGFRVVRKSKSRQLRVLNLRIGVFGGQEGTFADGRFSDTSRT